MSLTHTPAMATPIKNSVTIDKPFDQAWNDMIKRMTVSQYRINNIEKASRIINLEYQIDNPADIKPPIRCFSKGTIEAQFLDYAKQ